MAATGASASDTLVVNAAISTGGTDSTATIDLYAGGSITLGSSASLSSSNTNNVRISTNYDPATGTTSQGNVGSTVTISTISISGGLSVADHGSVGLTVDSNARVQTTTQDQVSDYFNALEPLLEVANEWDASDAGTLQASIGLGEISLDCGTEASIEVEDEVDED